ncbi:MAG: efflux RND transporter permease subunit [Phycisphaerae bacterium]
MTEPRDLTPEGLSPEQQSWIGRILGFVLQNKLVVLLFVVFIVVVGVAMAPFDWDLGPWPRSPVPTDAIPDIGENQQIVFTEWMGRSPQDVEDQVSYPLTVALLGIPGVKTIRSYSFFGFSSIYIIFREDIEFYWSRSRVLEKLNSLPAGTLPPDVQPALGPDATALGQIFWYTLEGMDPDGKPAGGWDLDELRTVQDWYVRYYLTAAEGVAEVASVGGFVQEYQVDVDPDAMRAYRVSLDEVFRAVRASNIDVGARTIEINRVEYFIRGIGFIEDVADIENSVIKMHDNVPVLVKNVAAVTTGPLIRRGALDKDGAEAVGGVVVARYGINPLAAIKNVKKKIDEIAPGLPTKVVIDFEQVTAAEVRRWADARGFDAYDGSDLGHGAWVRTLRAMPRGEWPAWATTSQVTVVPFYDRTGLIYETLGTLNDALAQEILITLIVVVMMVMHLRSSLLVGSMLPLAVLLCFVAMRLFGVDANIVALSGIAIAIGTIVDMGVVVSENILRHMDEAPQGTSLMTLVHRAASEVGSAVVTAVLTTVVSFLPVFVMIGAEGKLFKPLAFTKTFALIASILIALLVIPPAAHSLFGLKVKGRKVRLGLGIGLITAGAVVGLAVAWWAGLVVAVPGLYLLVKPHVPGWVARYAPLAANLAIVVVVGLVLSAYWEPLGPERGFVRNAVFVGALVGGLLGFFYVFRLVYPWVLRLCLAHKVPFLLVTGVVLLFGMTVWLGFGTIFGPVARLAGKVGVPPERVRSTAFWTWGEEVLPGLGKEFMPPLDEGSFLLMPTTMVHASIGEATDILATQDQALAAVPEIDRAVGKIGRVESPLDPAPISMIETVINYKSEYVTDKAGRRTTFRFNPNGTDLFRNEAGEPVPAPDGEPYVVQGKFVRDDAGRLIPDPDGVPFRQWRPPLDPELNPGRDFWPGVNSPDAIWDLIVEVTQIPGTTSAPKLQPIAARIVMLQSGMRAPMGVKVKGPDLETIEEVGLAIERFLKEVPGVQSNTVIADRIVGKPYLEIVPDRVALARYGVPIRAFQNVVEVAIGGRPITTTVEGRERFPVRVRYLRELRDRPDRMDDILVPAADGTQIPLEQVADIEYVRGPQVIKSEDTFLTGYVIFDKKAGRAEVDVVEECQAYLQEKIDSGELVLPRGVSYTFAGNYQNQIRSQKTLMVVLPIALFLIFLILYFQFKSIPTTLLVFSGIFVAWAGGFLLLWLYARPWFLDVSVFGVNMRNLFQVHPINLSVAVWVGFLALFGIASDNGVIVSTYLDQVFRSQTPASVREMREATLVAAERRVRPCLMTTATTILALIPVLTSTGRGSDVMVPMAIPSFGGMLVVLISIFVVPVLYCTVKEFRRHTGISETWIGVFLIATALVGFLPIAVYCAGHDLFVRLRGRQENR